MALILKSGGQSESSASDLEMHGGHYDSRVESYSAPFCSTQFIGKGALLGDKVHLSQEQMLKLGELKVYEFTDAETKEIARRLIN